MSDMYIYSVDNVIAQLADAPSKLGYYELRFYTENGRPAKQPTDTTGIFYYYPSGGTIRDERMNIIYYEPKLDRYKASRP